VSRTEFEAFERVRQSGRTNMFDVQVVCALSGLRKDVVLAIMCDYATLQKQYERKER